MTQRFFNLANLAFAALASTMLGACASSPPASESAGAPPASGPVSARFTGLTFRRRFPSQRQFVFIRLEKDRMVYWGGPAAFTTAEPTAAPTWSETLTREEMAGVIRALDAAAEPPSTPREGDQPEYQLTLLRAGSLFSPTYRSGPDPYYDALYQTLFGIVARRRAGAADAFMPPERSSP